MPGSQRASYPMPLGLANSLELPCVRKPHLNAGDVLFFAGVAHGTTAWRNQSWERRTVIQFFGSADRTIEPEDEIYFAGPNGEELALDQFQVHVEAANDGVGVQLLKHAPYD